MLKSNSLFLHILFGVVLTLTVSAETLPKVIRFGEVGGNNVKSIDGKPVGVQLVALAEHLGYWEAEFGKDGPKIEQVFFTGTGPAQNEALAQGNIDFGTYGGVPNVIGLTGKIPAHVVLARRSTNTGLYYVGVRPDSAINQVADLRGKRIAVQKGTNPHQALVQLLEAKGLKENDVTIVNLPGNEAVVAFTAGAIDAIFGGGQLFLLRDQNKVRIIEETLDFHAPASASGMLVSAKFEKEYPSTVARVVKVLVKTSAWYAQDEHRDELLKFIADRSVSFEATKRQYSGNLKDRFNPRIDEYTYEAYAGTAKWAAEHKLIRRAPDDATLRSWFKPDYVEAAIKELQLEKVWNSSQTVASGS